MLNLKNALKSPKLLAQARRRAHLVMALVAVVTLAQFVNSNTSALSSWKGGGFGMYTDPHPNNRTVWLVLESADATHGFRLMPPADGIAAQRERLGGEARHALDSAILLANDMLTYPRDELTSEIAARLPQLSWRLTPDGEVSLVEGAPLAVEGYRLQVFELRTSIQSASIGVENVYDRAIRARDDTNSVALARPAD